MLRHFQRHESQFILNTPIFRLRRDRASHPITQHMGDYFVLECPDWVNLIALTEDQQLLLVRQWRHGTGEVELEIPAGMVERGESPLAAAARELREETGYEATSLRMIGQVAPNAAFQQNICSTILAEGCRKLHDTSFDEGEDIEVISVPLNEVRTLIKSGQIRTGMVIAGLFWWLQETNRFPW